MSTPTGPNTQYSARRLELLPTTPGYRVVALLKDGRRVPAKTGALPPDAVAWYDTNKRIAAPLRKRK
jgi:hypothetical protein